MVTYDNLLTTTRKIALTCHPDKAGLFAELQKHPFLLPLSIQTSKDAKIGNFLQRSVSVENVVLDVTALANRCESMRKSSPRNVAWLHHAFQATLHSL